MNNNVICLHKILQISISDHIIHFQQEAQIRHCLPKVCIIYLHLNWFDKTQPKTRCNGWYSSVVIPGCKNKINSCKYQSDSMYAGVLDLGFVLFKCLPLAKCSNVCCWQNFAEKPSFAATLWPGSEAPRSWNGKQTYFIENVNQDAPPLARISKL